MNDKDLIERLRDIAGDMNYCNGRMCAAEGTMDEAADRLEKLRRHLDNIKIRSYELGQPGHELE